MCRSFGTALGVALVTIVWELTRSHSMDLRFRSVVVALLLIALVTAVNALRGRALQSPHAVK